MKKVLLVGAVVLLAAGGVWLYMLKKKKEGPEPGSAVAPGTAADPGTGTVAGSAAVPGTTPAPGSGSNTGIAPVQTPVPTNGLVPPVSTPVIPIQAMGDPVPYLLEGLSPEDLNSLNGFCSRKKSFTLFQSGKIGYNSMLLPIKLKPAPDSQEGFAEAVWMKYGSQGSAKDFLAAIKQYKECV